MPDDDAYSMQIICNIAHHNNMLVSTDLDADTVLKIAILVDKYDFASTVRFASFIWLQQDTANVCLEDHVKLLSAAYLLREPKTFRTLSKGLVKDNNSTAAEIYELVEEKYLPVQILCETMSNS